MFTCPSITWSWFNLCNQSLKTHPTTVGALKIFLGKLRPSSTLYCIQRIIWVHLNSSLIFGSFDTCACVPPFCAYLVCTKILKTYWLWRYFDLASTKSYAFVSCQNKLVMKFVGQIVRTISFFFNLAHDPRIAFRIQHLLRNIACMLKNIIFDFELICYCWTQFANSNPKTPNTLRNIRISFFEGVQ